MSLERLIPNTLQELLPVFSGNPIWLVGGWVRDHFLQRETHDLDLVLDGDAIAVGRACADAVHGDFYVLDAERRICRVLYMQDGHRVTLDLAALRAPGIEEDLNSRDFTMNALAVNLHDGELVDPTGGLSDLKDGLLEICAPDAFRRDPIRALRAVRFAVDLDLRWTNATLSGLRSAKELLSSVSTERIRDELFNILALTDPDAALRLMEHEELVRYVLPGMEPGRGHVEIVSQARQIMAWLSPGRGGHAGSMLEAQILQLVGSRRRDLFSVLEHANPSGRRPRELLLLCAYLLGDASLETHAKSQVYEQYGKAAAQHLRLSRSEQAFIERVFAVQPLLEELDAIQTFHASMGYRMYQESGDAFWPAVLLFLARKLAPSGGPPSPDDVQRLLVTAAFLIEEVVDKQSAFSMEPIMNGDAIQELLGIEPGRDVGWVLSQLKEAQALGNIQTAEEAAAYVQALWSSRSS